MWDETTVGTIRSIIIATLGSLCAYFIVPHNSHRMLDWYRIVRRVVLGAGAGFLYYWAMVYYGLPNHIATFWAGWFAENVLYAMNNRYSSWKTESEKKKKKKKKGDEEE